MDIDDPALTSTTTVVVTTSVPAATTATASLAVEGTTQPQFGNDTTKSVTQPSESGNITPTNNNPSDKTPPNDISAPLSPLSELDDSDFDRTIAEFGHYDPNIFTDYNDPAELLASVLPTTPAV
ncbi:hypothetical protein K474DRAFT_1775981 [Panus rudis PR-1116 ss-1]|nr:hypothetical protein K474DRAFT_1775981 [Panus rudis PR-1116 ss-1]